MIASVAYVDPGNFGTDISGGASYGYVLMWAVVMANLMAMLLQYLSGKLGISDGIVAGRDYEGKVEGAFENHPILVGIGNVRRGDGLG